MELTDAAGGDGCNLVETIGAGSVTAGARPDCSLIPFRRNEPFSTRGESRADRARQVFFVG